jgi:hypothetical protein
MTVTIHSKPKRSSVTMMDEALSNDQVLSSMISRHPNDRTCPSASDGQRNDRSRLGGYLDDPENIPYDQQLSYISSVRWIDRMGTDMCCAL